MLARLLCLSLALAATPLVEAKAAAPQGFLAGLKTHHLLTSTVPANGDQNPYALVIAPVSAGSVQKGDVLIDNFNNSGNLQGTGSTIMDYRPGTGAISLFAAIPRTLAGCPGGVGLTTAMTMLSSGWVIVGSAPSQDGTTKTLGKGCLIVLDPKGAVAGTIADANIDDPWGNMAVIDHGTSATLFISNVGFGIGAPGQAAQPHATVLRMGLTIAPGQPPKVASETVIGSGFSSQADASVFLIGPTGLSLAPNGTLYVSDALANRVTAISDAATRTAAAGTGTTVSTGGLLNRPLAMDIAPDGHLIVVNGLNGQLVEIDPSTGKQTGAMWVDTDEAQTPPGSGDLFGVAMRPDGKGVYYVEDDLNTLMVQQ
jgi:sugar lactone lactonase YvrE